MPMMLGFARHRRQLLEAELRRIASELGRLGVVNAYLVGDLARDAVGPESELELLLVHATDAPVQRRADFFVSHLLPCVGTQFLVYTPREFEQARDEDPAIRAILARAEQL